MKLTGKCNEDFGMWFFERNTPIEEYKNYHSLSDTCKNALIIDFFDSVGIYIGVLICIDETFDSYILQNDVRTECSQFQENRINAINAAIEKANEIYNNDNMLHGSQTK